MDCATDYEIGTEFLKGGSVEKTSDTDGDWKHIAFFSNGQTRFLRITKEGAKGFINIPLKDNTLIICSGEQFQEQFKNQIDTIEDENVAIGSTIVTKLRFRRPKLAGTRTI